MSQVTVFALFLFIFIFITLTTRISCFSEVINSNVILPPNGTPDIIDSSRSTWKLLKDTWPYRFAANCGGYLWVIVPLGLLVFLVKKGYVKNEAITQNRYIRLFIDGNEAEGFLYAQLPVTNGDIDSDLSKLSPEVARQKWQRDVIKLVVCFLGLHGSYLTWGLLQEKIMTQDYLVEIKFFVDHEHHRSMESSLISVSQTDLHPDMYSVKFLNSQFLVFINRVLAFFVAVTLLVYSNRRHLYQYFHQTRQPPLYMYSYCCLSNILSSWCQYEALKYVSFPVQVLSKGCKMIAVMLMSVCLRSKKYKRVEWLFAFTISFGIWLFLLNEEQSNSLKHKAVMGAAADHSASHSMLFSGILLLGLYLTFDSFTSNWQSELFDRYKVSSIHMMAAVNFYAILFTSVSLISQSEFFSAFRLMLANTALFRDCLILSISSAIGQLFVYYTIANFGAVAFTLIMTLRQVFAILLSIFTFGHAISVWGFLGITIVFGSIFTNMWYKYQARMAPKVKGGNKAEV